MSGANLVNARMSMIILEEADLSGASLSGAIFCETTMPDGSIRNDGCGE
ncbi:MAG: pentapeptide repeat-containing protein [Rivularia sp. (in: cyanobacteria)]